jgi:hypothetical protein
MWNVSFVANKGGGMKVVMKFKRKCTGSYCLNGIIVIESYWNFKYKDFFWHVEYDGATYVTYPSLRGAKQAAIWMLEYLNTHDTINYADLKDCAGFGPREG